MKFSRNLFVSMGPDVPDSIRAPMMLNAINVEFERDLVGYEDLFIWCNHNCTSLFTCVKSSYNSACFMFHLELDMYKFLEYLSINC